MISLILLLLAGVCESEVSYDGYSVIRITPVTESQLSFLLELNANTTNGLDFWLRSTAVNQTAEVMVASWAKHSLLRDLRKARIPYEITIQNIGRLIEEERNDKVSVPSGFEFFANYNPVDKIYSFMRNLSMHHADRVSLLEIGQSAEGRPLMVLRISRSPSEDKPAVWIHGGAHAREQIGPAVTLFLALQLGSLCDECEKLLETFDWYIHPVLNPDGYEYCQTEDRLWRKTRSRDPEYPECVGVDSNRNWDFAFSDTAGSSKDPCSHNYAGSSAFSEPETKAVAEFITDHLSDRLQLFLDFHSYSQRWLAPWGYTSEPPPDYDDQIRLAKVATNALEAVFGTKYSVGSSGNILYTVSGGARDWIYGVIGTKYCYVVELRDKGSYGFLLPRKQILPTAQETWAGVFAMAKELAKELSDDVP